MAATTGTVHVTITGDASQLIAEVNRAEAALRELDPRTLRYRLIRWLLRT